MRSLVVFGFAAVLVASTARAQGLVPGKQGTPQAPLPQIISPSSPATLPQTVPPSAFGSQPSKPPEPATPLVENLRKFDPNTVSLTWANNRWVLADGGSVLKDFGRRESEGQLALRLIRTLHLNQCGTVGTPAPAMEYWLSDGAAPRGPIAGCTVLTFDTDSLHMEEALGQWCVRDARRVLFNFGSRAEDARQALAVLRKYEFSQVAVVGQLTPSMFVFLANPYSGAAKADHPAHQRVSHETPETAAKKADEMNRLKARIPGLEAETVAQPALRPLRTPDQPRQAFTPTAREYGGDGLGSLNKSRPTSAADHGDRVPFDWRQVQVRLDGTDWKLTAGSIVLATFGADQEAARRALDVVRYYRFTELCIVGRPQRHFSYFLSNGLAPRGLPFGTAGEPFLAKALKVAQVEGRWALCAGDRPVIVLGEQREEASDLLQVIVRQRFDHVCRLGRPEDGFTFLVRTQ
jgi:hypothetical protein